MRKPIATIATAAGLLGALLGAAPASAEFGLNSFDVGYFNADGTPAHQAGSHPYAQVTRFKSNSDGASPPLLDGKIKDIFVEQLTGFVGDGTMPRCSTADFLAAHPEFTDQTNLTACPDSAAVGVTDIFVFDEFGGTLFRTSPVYNLAPPPGKAARIGFRVRGVPALVDVVPAEEFPHNLLASSLNTSAAVPIVSVRVMLWGVPADPRHDFARGSCARNGPDGDFDFQLTVASTGAKCSSGAEPKPFLTLPRSCDSSTETSYRASSWEAPNVFDSGGVFNDTHTFADMMSDGSPAPADSQPFTGCAKLGFGPTISGATTTRAAQSPTGLNFNLDVETGGLTDAILGEGGEDIPLANTEIKKAVVTLPEGVTANPSLAEGLEVCTEAQLAAETAASPPGAGCPEASKIGTVEVESPLIHEQVNGAVYIAEPFKNVHGTLIALYIVIKNSNLGIVVKNRLKVEPDPRTGQLVTTVADIPQLPFSKFRMRLREGGRSPLVSPPSCGTHRITAELTPWSGGPTKVETSAFEIISGPNNGPCPPGGTLPFEPGFEAGTLNNNAASYSPYLMRLQRRDGDQDLTRFDAVLPQGVLAKLAGVGKCPDAAIAAIKAKTGKQELASPSCPANSKIGNVWGGAGVGSQLTYVPGSVYLAGPFAGAPLSVVGVVPAVAGPFDVGVVLTRQALVVNRATGVVRVDGARSEPIPHILAGIPLNVRDIQVRVDRPEFTLNPTSCEPFSTDADIWGGGLNVFSTHDDSPVARSARFQAANCTRLGFRPHLRLDLRGGTRRGANPALRAVLRPKPGNANIEKTIVRLPRSAFLDQSHIRTICTRVQWAQDNCPKASRYGRVVAHTPLLDEPLRGPAYLRSSDNLLPDLVFDLRGEVNIESGARVDSIRGGIRAIFAGIPDAPLSRVVVHMAGGKRGLIVNSRNLCRGRNRANVRFDGHNGAEHKFKPLVRNANCNKKRKAKRGAHRSAAKGAF